MTYSAVAQTWISITDLTAATKLVLSEEQQTLAAVLLARYAGELETQLSRKVSMTITDESAEVLGELIVTRYRPVTSVTSVAGYTVWDASSGNIRLTAPLPVNGSRVLVTYTAGFDGPELDALRSVVTGRTLRTLIRDQDDALGVSNVNEEGHSESYLEDTWTPGEQRTIDALRRRVGAR